MSKMMTSEAIKPTSAPGFFQRLLCWEGFLLAVTLAVFVVNALASPYHPLIAPLAKFANPA